MVIQQILSNKINIEKQQSVWQYGMMVL